MKSKHAPRILAALASISILCCATVRAQTLQFKYTFEDGPGTTTTDDPSSAIYPLTMNMLYGSGTATDLHGATGSGVQGQGVGMNLSTNPIAGNLGGSFALVQNSATLGAIGIVTDFTASVWINMPNLQTNMANQGSRIFNLTGTGITDIGGINSIGFQPQYANTATPLFPRWNMRAVIGTTFVNPAIYYNVPTNVWLFFAMTYNSVSGVANVYYGTEASPAKLYMTKNIGAGTNFNFSGTPSFSLGDRPSKGRSFPGLIDDARFYTGAASASTIETIRQSSTPIVVTNLSPDGSLLQSGTNVLSFTATSPNGINSANIKVLVNGSNVTSGLTFTPTTGGQIVNYVNLPINPTILSQTNLDGVNVAVQISDNGGINTSNSYVYDAFCTTNFTWEAEDFDFNNGTFIDNPVVSFVGPDTNTYYQEQTPYVSLVDVNDNGNTAGLLRVYRDPTYPVETEYSVGGGGPTAGGQNLGELMRQKVLDAYNITNIAGEVNVGFFDGGTGPGLPNWMNYTRTFPTGDYNVYLRFADGGGTLTASLDQVTSGWGTTSQTITNLGTFNMVNSGGWDNFMWVPLRDSSGNLARVQLSGTNTIRLTAGNGGGGNVNFLMLTPANTNLPAINNVYPNGTNMFQSSPTLSFGASSPSGVAINASAVKVRLTVTNLLGQGFVTNMTSTNGLTISGSPTNLLVTAPLITNSFYTASITIADVNGSAVGNSVTFDTLAPAYTWEAPDYDYGGSLFVPDPIPVDGYLNLSGQSGVDFNFVNIPPFNNYRDGGIVGVEGGTGDFPLRLQYLTNNPVPAAYDLGYFNGGNWLNYTRVFPSGLYNIFVRAADGSAALGNVGISQVTDGWGTSVQTTTNLGSFNIPVTGGWQTYTWVPLRDPSGNLVKFNGGGTTNTLRATSAGSQNVFFYALFPANTNLPILSSVSPLNGSKLTNTFSFKVQSTAGVSSNNVVVTVNGIVVSNLVFTGTINNWTIAYPHLVPTTVYVITVSVTDVNGNTSTTSASFDTINPSNYTWEAEDFDHDGGYFIDNSQTNAYLGLGAIAGVDTVQVNFAGGYNYRSSGMDTAVNGDVVRPQYQDPLNPQSDYELGYFSDGAWANYTRNYPAGSYNIYGRFATASTSGLGTDALLAQVTSGWGTTLQSSNVLGSFAIPNTGGWETYTYVPLRDGSGNMVTVTFNGSTNTLTLIRPVDVPASADLNVNFMMLVPVMTASAAQSGTNLVITFATLGGFNYQVQYKTNLLDPTWLPLGSPIPGNNGNKSVSDPDNNKNTRFYRVQVQ